MRVWYVIEADECCAISSTQAQIAATPGRRLERPLCIAPVPTGMGAICASMLGAIPALVGRADGRGDGQDIAVISWIGMVHISLDICRQ